MELRNKMVQVIEQAPNAFGRLGKGLAEGFKDLPQAAARGRLADTLESLKSEPDALKQIAALTRAGVSSADIAQYQPLIRNAAIRNKDEEASKRNTPNGQNPIVIQNQIPQAQTQGQPGQQGQNPQDNPNTITQASGQAAQRQLVIPPTTEQKDQRARQLMRENPELYEGPNAYANAYARAEEELELPGKIQAREIEAEDRRERQETLAGARFDTEVSNKLQKGSKNDLNQVLPAEALQRFKDRYEARVAKGESARDASKIESNNALELAKAENTLRNNIGTRPFFGKVGKELQDDIDTLRSTFSKFGEEELFKNEQKNYLDIGDHLASYNTWKPSKGLEFELAKLSPNDSPKQVAAKLSDKITDKDSIFTTGFLLNKRGFDDKAIVDELKQLKSKNIFKTDERQNRELTEYYPLNPRLGDSLWAAFAGPVGIAGESLFNYLTGQRKKVGTIQRIKQNLGKE